MKLWAATGLAGIALMLAGNAAAQTLYVDDRLQIGLHVQPNVSSNITQLLSSGSELTLIERNGPLAKVRTADGVEGWVDGSYLSETPPARARLLEMESELAGAQAALADLQAKFVVLEQSTQQQQQQSEQAAPLTSDALREMQQLAEENQRLKQQVAEIEAVRRMTRERAPTVLSKNAPSESLAAASTTDTPDNDDPDSAVIKVSRLQHWHLILLASVLLLAFSIGGWLVDWGIRRRHGGFRI